MNQKWKVRYLFSERSAPCTSAAQVNFGNSGQPSPHKWSPETSLCKAVLSLKTLFSSSVQSFFFFKKKPFPATPQVFYFSFSPLSIIISIRVQIYCPSVNICDQSLSPNFAAKFFYVRIVAYNFRQYQDFKLPDLQRTRLNNHLRRNRNDLQYVNPLISQTEAYILPKIAV